MADTVQTAPETKTAEPPVVVKKYANRRLYDTRSSSYITLDNLAEMVRQGRDFVVYDAKTGEDITRGVLTQIIVEEEGKGRSLLPTAFLRQLIGFYGDQMQSLVPKYLEQAMAAFAAAAGANARGDAEDDGIGGHSLSVRQHGRGEQAEHGDDGTGVQFVHPVLSADWRGSRRPSGRRGPGRPSGRRRTRRRDRLVARRGGAPAPGTGGGQGSQGNCHPRSDAARKATAQSVGRPTR